MQLLKMCILQFILLKLYNFYMHKDVWNECVHTYIFGSIHPQATNTLNVERFRFCIFHASLRLFFQHANVIISGFLF